MVGKRCIIVADGRIGAGSVLSNRVRITGAGTVELEGDNWVGTGATLVAPVTLGRGAVVAPGTVVTGVVPAMTIAAGDPGKVIGSRFSNDVIRQQEDAGCRSAADEPPGRPLSTSEAHTKGPDAIQLGQITPVPEL